MRKERSDWAIEGLSLHKIQGSNTERKFFHLYISSYCSWSHIRNEIFLKKKEKKKKQGTWVGLSRLSD